MVVRRDVVLAGAVVGRGVTEVISVGEVATVGEMVTGPATRGRTEVVA